jgi:hypothetical protein
MATRLCRRVLIQTVKALGMIGELIWKINLSYPDNWYDYIEREMSEGGRLDPFGEHPELRRIYKLDALDN